MSNHTIHTDNNFTLPWQQIFLFFVMHAHLSVTTVAVESKHIFSKKQFLTLKFSETRNKIILVTKYHIIMHLQLHVFWKKSILLVLFDSCKFQNTMTYLIHKPLLVPILAHSTRTYSTTIHRMMRRWISLIVTFCKADGIIVPSVEEWEN